MKKLLILAPHLSTGGLPKFLLWQIEQLINQYDVYLIEYSYAGPDFVVHRNQILKLIDTDKFFSLNDKTELLSIVAKVNPNIIYFAEIPELFCDLQIAKQIYSNRNHYIVETTHCSDFDINNKIFLPDKFIFVCEWSKQQYSSFNIPSEIIEYPIFDFKRPNRSEALKILNLNPDKKHIVNIGLWTPGKNQKEIFEYAKSLPEYQFHFVGNLASNFKTYWQPLLENKPENCIIHGELNNVSDWLSACDLFLFTSKYELMPLVIKEALSWHLPILMYPLETYCNSYDNQPLVTYLLNDTDNNLTLIQNAITSLSI